jgi:hypothetical protein
VPSLDLRERLGSKGAKRVVGKRVLTKDVSIGATLVPFAVEEIGIPQDRKLRFLYADDAAQLVQPLSLQRSLEPLEVCSCGWVVEACTGLWRRVRSGLRLGWIEGIDELLAEACHAIPHQIAAYHTFGEALLVDLVDHSLAE